MKVKAKLETETKCRNGEISWNNVANLEEELVNELEQELLAEVAE